jgi:fructan beta-fructosidase
MRAVLTATLTALLVGSLLADATKESPAVGPRADLLIEDFEGPGYGAWKVQGTAFGTGPARGTLPGQMPVTGFLGKGLANSYHGGDDSTGTLTSPAFKIQRRYINFLIGGGKYPGETCIHLLVNGKAVRTATGPNDRPGGSEQLDWHAWDVADLQGKEAVLQIVDQRKGGWGHICIDHIVQGDQKKQPAGPALREIVLQKQYLHLPVKNKAPKRRVQVVHQGRPVREFEIELAPAEPDFWVFLDVGAWRGQKLAVAVDRLPADSRGFAAVTQADQVPDAANLYREKDRPGFHFTARRGWLNDPNGLVYYRGEYHLFFQHNPYGWDWGNMHWGHAVSKDLVHWQELPEALYPRKFGDWCFSGSAVVDAGNTAGWKTGTADVLVAAFTSTGRGECIVYSNDAGRSWREYAGNPVVKHAGRDPRLLWRLASKSWVMAVYDEHQGGKYIAFYTSPDLKSWAFQSRIAGFYECPDLFELPVDGDPRTTKWVLYAADGKYVLGRFDGKTFHPEPGKHQLWYGNFYAAQTFSNAPGGRRLQLGWGNGITFPGMPFNQQMTVPVELTLRTTADGPRLFAEPVSLDSLHVGEGLKRTDWKVKEGDHALRTEGELLQIRADFELGNSKTVGLTVHGVSVRYDVRKQQLSCGSIVAPLAPVGGAIHLHLVVDRGSVEVFGNGGRVALSRGGILPRGRPGVTVNVRGGQATVVRAQVIPLRSAWPDPRK